MHITQRDIRATIVIYMLLIGMAAFSGVFLLEKVTVAKTLVKVVAFVAIMTCSYFGMRKIKSILYERVRTDRTVASMRLLQTGAHFRLANVMPWMYFFFELEGTSTEKDVVLAIRHRSPLLTNAQRSMASAGGSDDVLFGVRESGDIVLLKANQRLEEFPDSAQ